MGCRSVLVTRPESDATVATLDNAERLAEAPGKDPEVTSHSPEGADALGCWPTRPDPARSVRVFPRCALGQAEQREHITRNVAKMVPPRSVTRHCLDRSPRNAHWPSGSRLRIRLWCPPGGCLVLTSPSLRPSRTAGGASSGVTHG
jgi:hypothetical protein